MYKRITLLAALLVAALVAAGCAGGSGPTEVTVNMEEFAFVPDQFSVPAGSEVNLTLTNTGALEHNFIVMNAGSEVEGTWAEADAANAFFTQNQTLAGETVTVTFTAPNEPGEYQFLCSVPAHLEQGMAGTLTVTE